MSQRQFLFLNTGDPSKGEHKISATGRAFVIRKARAAHSWSTKSKKKPKQQVHQKLKNGLDRASTSPSAADATVPQRNSHARQWPSSFPQRRQTHRQTTQRNVGEDDCLYNLSHHPECHGCRLSHDPSILERCQTVAPMPAGRLDTGIDPFRAMSLDLNELDTSLLAYYHVADKCLSPRITLLDSGRKSLEVHQYWKTMSLEHPGFMHGVLCIAAVKLALLQPNQAPELVERFMYHRIQAMAAIRRNLADPELALSDESLASVFNMVCSEEILALEASQGLASNPAWALLGPDDTQREAHMVGWRRMVQLRGGLRALSTRLQSFVVRWGHSALSNVLISMYSLPHMYRSAELAPPAAVSIPSNKASCKPCVRNQVIERSDFAVARFLPAHRSLPKNVLARFHQYPQTSPFASISSPMAEACKSVDMHPGLVDIVFTVHCMIRDGMSWLIDRSKYSWDQYQLQNMFATSMGELVRWIYEHEMVLSAPESVTALSIFAFLLLSCDGQHSVCGPLPGIMPRLRQQIQEPNVRPVLREAGIDTWVAVVLLIATKDSPESCKRFFLQYYLETVSARSPPLRSFEDLLDSLKDCIWTPAMTVHARNIYNAKQNTH
ncbi:hypothetical protein V8F20_001280 [Naviculisporaceae sp. PSN 640]